MLLKFAVKIILNKFGNLF